MAVSSGSSQTVDSEWPMSTHSTAESTTGWRNLISISNKKSNQYPIRNSSVMYVYIEEVALSVCFACFFWFVRLKLHGIIGQL